jgi:transcription antitermination factor NusG
MSNWYAVRLKPMAARPSKHDPRYTNIEYALGSAGIEHYLPLDRREIIHHRTKKPIDKAFPLLPGYAFVCDVDDWYELHRVDYVAGVLGVGGTPLRLHGTDIENIRIAEGEIFQRYEAQKAKRRLEEEMKEKHIPQRRARVLYPAGSTVKINEAHMLLGGRNAIVKEATGRDTIRALVETLNGMVTAELPLAMVSKVA